MEKPRRACECLETRLLVGLSLLGIRVECSASQDLCTVPLFADLRQCDYAPARTVGS